MHNSYIVLGNLRGNNFGQEIFYKKKGNSESVKCSLVIFGYFCLHFHVMQLQNSREI